MVRTATYLTLSQAAAETGKSKSVIHKALNDGTLSSVEKDDSGYKIDPAELFRVFPKNAVLEQEKERSRTPERTERTASNAHENDSDINTLRVENKVLYARIQDKEDRIKELAADKEELREERDKWHKTAERLLLTHHVPEKPSAEPVETGKEAEEGVTPEKSEEGPKNANMVVYGILGGSLLLLTAVMNYFQVEIKTFIDRDVLGVKAAHGERESERLKPAENEEEERGEPRKEPLQSYPVLPLQPKPF